MAASNWIKSVLCAIFVVYFSPKACVSQVTCDIDRDPGWKCLRFDGLNDDRVDLNGDWLSDPNTCQDGMYHYTSYDHPGIHLCHCEDGYNWIFTDILCNNTVGHMLARCWKARHDIQYCYAADWRIQNGSGGEYTAPYSVSVVRSNVDCPTFAPTNSPTSSPSFMTLPPTNAPSNSPTFVSLAPTNAPSLSPTQHPSHSPTFVSLTPSNAPSSAPTLAPSDAPTFVTSNPSNPPTAAPSNTPSIPPTKSPTNAPSLSPSNSPSLPPTNAPTQQPSNTPSNSPTTTPSNTPSNAPSINAYVSTTTDSIYKTGNGVTFDNDIYIALLIIILGIFCIICTAICFKYQTRNQPKDIYQIPKKRSEQFQPNIIALAESHANITQITSLSNELNSSNAALSSNNAFAADADPTTEVMMMEDINSVNIISEDNDEMLEIKQWLTDKVKLPQYYQHFVTNGYERIEFIKDIQIKSELEAIGITKAGHKNRIFKQIEFLRNDNYEKELITILPEIKDVDIEEETQGIKRHKPKHKIKSISYFSHDLSSLHYEEWKLEAEKRRGSLSVSSVAARGQNPDDMDLNQVDSKKTSGFMAEEMSSSEESHNMHTSQ